MVVKRGEIPHINQIARIVLHPGQIATENSHMDMSEVFYIVSGEGVFKYDGEERAIKVERIGASAFTVIHSIESEMSWQAGDTIRAMPAHKHEVINKEQSQTDLDMLVNVQML